MESSYAVNRWFSPRYAVNYFANLQKLTDKKLKKAKYKKEHEAWIVGDALFGIMK